MTILQTVIAGVVGTGFMTVLMTIIHLSGWANADMIRALGSAVTRTLHNALGWGLLIHLLVGVAWAFPYTILLSALGPTSFLMAAGLGALLGTVHGLIMSLALLAIVAERHPLEEFKRAGAEVAIAHIFGHIAYGVGVAITAHAFGIDWGLL